MRVTVLCLALLVSSVVAHCPQQCNGRGTCTSNTCTCYEGWTGPSCLDRTCPSGNAWTGVTNDTDLLHSLQAQCSNKGTCNTNTGQCECFSGFTGLACERMSCQNDCNGHGRCMSMSDAASTFDGYRLTTDTTYQLWDAEKIHGCVCDPGYKGYDCSLRECPFGDDPETAGQDEVQTISCECTSCSGYFVLTYRGATSGKIYHNAVAKITDEDGSVNTGTGAGESVEAKLEAMRTILGVTVSINGTGSVCQSSKAVTQITFTQEGGNVPDMTLTSSIGGSNVDVFMSYDGVGESSTGTTEFVECSRRGLCNYAQGTCDCFTGYTYSNGNGGAGTIGDCGYEDPWLANITSCPGVNTGAGACSGHGTCDTATKYCTCHDGYFGGDCSWRTCPRGLAWFDEATAANTAHAEAECSNRGICNYLTGECTCQTGFTGGACQRLDCPTGSSTQTCNGRGRCFTVRELARKARHNGDWRGELEVQHLQCTQGSGNFVLIFKHAVTTSIAWDSTAAQVETALEALPTIGQVQVEFSTGVAACAASTPPTIKVTFLTDLGPQPRITAESINNIGIITSETIVNGSRLSYGETFGNEATWDGDKIMGCMCDNWPNYNRTSIYAGHDTGTWINPDCSKRSCPFGHDPNLFLDTSLLHGEQQRINCTATSGTITLTFRGESTSALAYNADQATVQAALNALDSVGYLTVNMTANQLCWHGVAYTYINFVSEIGDVPLIDVSYSGGNFNEEIVIDEVIPGNATLTECSSRGVCDHNTGICQCFSGYVSSDGYGRRGTRGDCGHRDALFQAVGVAG